MVLVVVVVPPINRGLLLLPLETTSLMRLDGIVQIRVVWTFADFY